MTVLLSALFQITLFIDIYFFYLTSEKHRSNNLSFIEVWFAPIIIHANMVSSSLSPSFSPFPCFSTKYQGSKGWLKKTAHHIKQGYKVQMMVSRSCFTLPPKYCLLPRAHFVRCKYGVRNILIVRSPRPSSVLNPGKPIFPSKSYLFILAQHTMDILFL